MTLDYRRLKAFPFAPIEQAYTERDTMLYALALGLGSDPLDRDERGFVTETDLKALPTMAVVLAHPGFLTGVSENGIDGVKLLHAEQGLRLFQPLRPRAVIVGHSAVTRIVDKGAGRGALVLTERRLTDPASGALIASLEQLTYCRAEGGYSAPSPEFPEGQPSDAAPTAPPAVPEDPPGAIVDLATRPSTALVYRLCGDMNPLHADPEVARAAGFERPILHGLATYGIAGRALLKTCCAWQPERLVSMRARFSAPVYPGETIRTEIWPREGHAHFRATVLERERIVLDRGYAEFESRADDR